MTNHIKFSLILALIVGVFITSCSSSEEGSKTYDITGIEAVNTFVVGDTLKVSISGPQNAITATSSNSQVATVAVGSDGKTLTIIALKEGTTTLTLSGTDANTRTIEVKVVATSSATVNGSSLLTIATTIKNSKGIWLLEANGFPYNKKGLFIGGIPNSPKAGDVISISVTSQLIDNVSTGTYSATVDHVSPNSVGITFGDNISLVIPR